MFLTRTGRRNSRSVLAYMFDVDFSAKNICTSRDMHPLYGKKQT